MTILADPTTPPTFKFNNQQEGALDDISRWFASSKASRYDRFSGETETIDPYLLQGYAGTGKTTLVKELLRRLGVPLARLALVAPTNRAAKVLSNKTGIPTRTLFSLIYATQREELDYQRARLRIWDEANNFSQLADLLVVNMEQDLVEEFNDEWEQNYDGHAEPGDREAAYEKFVALRHETVLQVENIILPDDAAARLDLFGKMRTERIKEHKKNIQDLIAEDLKITKRDPKDISGKYDAILCDEASMVTDQQGKDLCSYGVPVILVGDPFQLPPVKAKAFWDGKRPQSQLTKIERQKGTGAGIPLVGQALRLGDTPRGNDSVTVHPRNSLTDDKWMAADQILCGTHKTRERLCAYIRRLKGFDGPAPMVGEKIVACYNDKAIGIMNGELYTVLECELQRGDSIIAMTIEDPYGKVIENIKAWTRGLVGRSATNYLDDEFGKFWWGYAITCHQSQGSEWKNVVVCDDWPRKSNEDEEYRRWLYTALTRASQHVDWIR
jgi:exodeoxyribonuclease-5